MSVKERTRKIQYMGSKLWTVIWEKMEIRRVFLAIVAVFRSVIRLFSFPVQWLDKAIEALRCLIKPVINQWMRPSKRRIYARMGASVVDGILENKNTAAGSRNLRQFKWLSIVLLEIASAITTAIGMIIVASDISPIIAFIWAFVIQGMAGVLSGVRGRLNGVILAVCMVFSIASDYVCYINAAYPYDVYIEGQYNQVKQSYDVAWEYACAITQEYASADAEIESAFDSVENDLVLLSSQYESEKLTQLKEELRQIQTDLAGISSTVRRQISTTVEVNPVTGIVIERPVYEYVVNPVYEDLIKRRNEVTAQLAALEGPSAKVTVVQDLYSELNRTYGGDARAYVKQLFKDMQSSDITAADQADTENTLAQINQKLLAVRGELDALLEVQEQNTDDSIALTQLQEKYEGYRKLQELKMPAFSELEQQIQEENLSVFDILLEDGAKLLDSEFAFNAMDLRELAQAQTDFYYVQFKETIAAELQADAVLRDLVYGRENTDQLNGVLSLEQAYEAVEYKDVISLSMGYFINFWEDPFTVLTRVLYAFLADGLVLLIGISLRRKNTAIYRIQNRRDLTNEEPRLISEAFYNLAMEGEDVVLDQKKLVQKLIGKLELFRNLFEAENFFRDPNLGSSYSLVCKDSNGQQILQKDFKELLSLLRTLKYIKPVSKKQYNFVKEYKLNKATLDKKGLEDLVKQLSGTDGEYYYLMTEGFSLYLSEKINDLYQYLEARKCGEDLKKDLLEMEG